MTLLDKHFFFFHHITNDEKLTVVAFYMTRVALLWYQLMHATHQLTSWEKKS